MQGEALLMRLIRDQPQHLAQRQDLGDLVEHSALTSILHQLINDSLILDRLEVEAGAANSVGLVSGGSAVHSQTLAVLLQVGLALVLMLVMSLSMVAIAEAPAADVFTSASVANYYGQFGLTDDALMEAVNSQSGFYLICTTNPDGSANAGVFIFAIKKLNDKYYLQLGLAPNQSSANLNANGEGLAVYAANPVEGAKAYAVSGARIRFAAIEDQAIIDALMLDARQGAMFFEIVDVQPLG